MGFQRFVTYVKQRIIRLSDSPHKIALGLALGLAASFNPFVGTHILQACGLAFLFRSNLVAAFIGTLLGNPLTLPFMWAAAIWVGHFFVTETFWAWVIGAYILGAVVTPPTYYLFLSLVKAGKRSRQLFLARKVMQK
jgi:uncharacterized protein (DUF2062 family)